MCSDPAGLCVFGSRTIVPMPWMCKKHQVVSQSRAGSPIVSLDACLRLDALPAHQLCNGVLGTSACARDRGNSDLKRRERDRNSPVASRDANSRLCLPVMQQGLCQHQRRPETEAAHQWPGLAHLNEQGQHAVHRFTGGDRAKLDDVGLSHHPQCLLRSRYSSVNGRRSSQLIVPMLATETLAEPLVDVHAWGHLGTTARATRLHTRRCGGCASHKRGSVPGDFGQTQASKVKQMVSAHMAKRVVV